MKIPSILDALGSLTPGKAQQRLEDRHAATAATEGTATASAPVDIGKLQRIVSRYDVRSISPREFSELAQDLFDQGAIDQRQFSDLSAIRAFLDAEGLSPDEPLDLVSQLEKHRDRAQRRLGESAHSKDADAGEAARSSVQLLDRQLDWLKKFEIIGSHGYGAGVDARV